MVTGDATLEVNGLLERMVSDPIALLERILQQVLDQAAQEYAFAADSDDPPEETIAVALGNRLAQMILNGNGSAVGEWSATGNDPEEPAQYEELLGRNAALAAALGACDCWGQHSDCTVCHGAGAPGWALPDRRLFASYVHPALRALTRRGAAPANVRRRTEHQRKES